MIQAWEDMKKELDEKDPDLRQQTGAVEEWDPSMPKIDLTKEL
jgi:hypothetical protein